MALFRNPKPVVYGIVAFALLAITAFATKCRAEPVFEVEAGMTVARAPAEAIALNLLWPDAGPKDADFSLGLVMVGSSRYGGKEQPNQAAIHFQMIDGFGRFDIGAGVVLLQNIDDFNGSHANFSLLAGYRFTDRLGLVFRHWSNAGTVKPNTGRDMLLLTWRF